MKTVKLSEILYPVELIETPMAAVSAQKFQVIGNIGGEKVLLNTCSSRYRLIPNSEIYPAIEKTLSTAGVEYDATYLSNGEKTVFSARYNLYRVNGKDVGVDVGGNDLIYPQIIQGNSYNGYKNGDAMFGYYRMICSNGLVIPVAGKDELNYGIKGKHTQKLVMDFETLNTQIDKFLASHGVYIKRFKSLTERYLPNWADRLETVIKATGLKPSKEQKEVIEKTVMDEKERLNLSKVNDWLVYNAINAYIYKSVNAAGETTKKTDDVKIKEDRKVLAYIMNN